MQLGQIGPVTALGLAAAAPRFGHAAPADPSATAAQAFVSALRHAGVSVAGVPRRVKAGPGAQTLGVVRSAPVRDLVDYTLLTSDNLEAEVLARLGAHAAGGAASFTGAAAHNLRAAAALGVPVSGARLYDGSGLARADLIPPQTLTAVLAAAAGSARPELRSLFAGLPVAGFSGTLVHRFTDRLSRAGAGIVRAKTGTLRGVNTLAGVAVDADGRLLAFAFMADHRTAKLGSAADLVDRAASTIATCGCR
jgi:D-alanyl-D-alanine carboxypeptidase/D-alanyl-D-alanine-endopeptidase (penicillin-binding protein 4)